MIFWEIVLHHKVVAAQETLTVLSIVSCSYMVKLLKDYKTGLKTS